MFIKLNTYEDFHGWDINGQCCDGTDQSGKCQPCDHYISACLKDNRDHGNGYNSDLCICIVQRPSLAQTGQ